MAIDASEFQLAETGKRFLVWRGQKLATDEAKRKRRQHELHAGNGEARAGGFAFAQDDSLTYFPQSYNQKLSTE